MLFRELLHQFSGVLRRRFHGQNVSADGLHHPGKRILTKLIRNLGKDRSVDVANHIPLRSGTRLDAFVG